MSKIYGILWSGLLLIYSMPYGGNLNDPLIRKLRNSFDSDPIEACSATHGSSHHRHDGSIYEAGKP